MLHGLLLHCCVVLVYRHELGEDVEGLLQVADACWKSNGYQETDQLFGYSSCALLSVSIDEWLMLLMRIMIMEYNSLLFTKRYRLQWGLTTALAALRQVGRLDPTTTPLALAGGNTHCFVWAKRQYPLLWRGC